MSATIELLRATPKARDACENRENRENREKSCEKISEKSCEERLAQLAASFGPLRRVLAAIAARLLDDCLYNLLSFRVLSEYAAERPGVSVRQLQELARVHRRLAGLPLLERALVRNELPWSKVRLVSGIATAEDEAAWIEFAVGVPTRQLEHDVAEARKASGGGEALEEEDAEAEPRVRLRLACTPGAAVGLASAAAPRLARARAQRVTRAS